MNKQIKIAIAVMSIILLVPIVVFIIIFYNSTVSDDITKWGAFGDYFGGILNTFLSFLSLVVTTFIAFQLMKIDKDRQKENHTFEREKMLREFREAEYKRITYELQKVQLSIFEPNLLEAGRVVTNAIYHFRAFRDSNSHLFSFLNDSEISELYTSLIGLLTMIEKNKEKFSDVDYSNRPTDNAKIMREYDIIEKKFHQKFQKYFLNL